MANDLMQRVDHAVQPAHRDSVLPAGLHLERGNLHRHDFVLRAARSDSLHDAGLLVVQHGDDLHGEPYALHEPHGTGALLSATRLRLAVDIVHL
jgi:hypothetical protein